MQPDYTATAIKAPTLASQRPQAWRKAASLGSKLGSLAGLLALGGCIPASTIPAPAPQAPPVQAQQQPAPLPAQPLPPQPSNWRDSAATPGEWRYVTGANGGTAFFISPQGSSLAALTCLRSQNTVTLTLAGSSPQIRVLTDSEQRVLNAQAGNGSVVASLTPRDTLLDAMMFSRGRFALETAGQQRLALPAWPEIARVAEDCR